MLIQTGLPFHLYWSRCWSCILLSFIDEHGFANRLVGPWLLLRVNLQTLGSFFVSCQCPNAAGLNAYRKWFFEDEAKPKISNWIFVSCTWRFIYKSPGMLKIIPTTWKKESEICILSARERSNFLLILYSWRLPYTVPRLSRFRMHAPLAIRLCMG